VCVCAVCTVCISHVTQSVALLRTIPCRRAIKRLNATHDEKERPMSITPGWPHGGPHNWPKTTDVQNGGAIGVIQAGWGEQEESCDCTLSQRMQEAGQQEGASQDDSTPFLDSAPLSTAERVRCPQGRQLRTASEHGAWCTWWSWNRGGSHSARHKNSRKSERTREKAETARLTWQPPCLPWMT